MTHGAPQGGHSGGLAGLGVIASITKLPMDMIIGIVGIGDKLLGEQGIFGGGSNVAQALTVASGLTVGIAAALGAAWVAELGTSIGAVALCGAACPPAWVPLIACFAVGAAAIMALEVGKAVTSQTVGRIAGA